MNKTKKILIVFGTRPEAIKMAPLVNELKCYPKLFNVIICVTAQHRQMLDQVLELFDINPEIDMNIMKDSQDLNDITSNVILGIKDVLKKYHPDIVLVHGDTTTTMATAMASFYEGIKIGHVEAGLRTYNINSPYPEEFNRQLVSKIATWHFAPTSLARENLLSDGINEKNIIVTGNTVIDILHWTLNRLCRRKNRVAEVNKSLEKSIPFNFKKDQFILVTGHRRENFGIGLKNICEAISELAFRFNDLKVVYPLHLNPHVKNSVNKVLSNIPNVFPIEPLRYEPFIFLMKNCKLVLTDSGGIQEEAPSLGKPVLVMRNTTERPEAINAGTVKLVGTNKNSIVEGVSSLIEDKDQYDKMSRAHNPYGDGKSSTRNANFLNNL